MPVLIFIIEETKKGGLSAASPLAPLQGKAAAGFPLQSLTLSITKFWAVNYFGKANAANPLPCALARGTKAKSYLALAPFIVDASLLMLPICKLDLLIPLDYKWSGTARLLNFIYTPQNHITETLKK